MKAADIPIDLGIVQSRSMVVGGIATVISVAGAFFGPTEFFRAYLLGYLFILALGVGCLALRMLFYLVGGQWGIVVSNSVDSAASTLKVLALLFIPLLFGLKWLYPWATVSAKAELTNEQTLYFKSWFFVGRSAAYFAIWMSLASLLKRHAHRRNSQVLRVGSGWGMALYFLSMSFAAVDWLMSLDVEWYSTIYGALVIVGQVLTALSALIVFVGIAAPKDLDQTAAKPLQDLGNLLLTFVLLWTYLAFMQFLVIWSGNLKYEIPWYLARSHGAWPWIALGLFLFHFLVPFLLLLSRGGKQRARALWKIACVVLAARIIDLFWLMGPAPEPQAIGSLWLYFTTPLALASLWLGLFFRHLKRHEAVLVLPANETVAA